MQEQDTAEEKRRKRVRERARVWRANNRDTYLERNREQMRKWRAKNREKHLEQQRNSSALRRCLPENKAKKRAWNDAHPLQNRLWRIKSSARSRGIEWNLMDAFATSLFHSNCYYCDSKPSLFNGLDRRDSDVGYVWHNVVPCCESCNSIKARMPEDQFWAYLGRITLHMKAWPHPAWQQSVSVPPCRGPIAARVRAYRRNAIVASRTWNLPYEMAAGLILSNCRYCGIQANPTIGIDRIDSSVGYEPDNVVPCCSVCNFAKRATPYQAFVDYLTRLANSQTSLAQNKVEL
jgi:hypothetical protein